MNLRNKRKLLEFATLFFWFSLYTYTSVFSPYLKELNIKSGTIGIILSSYGLSQLILRIPIGLLSDKYENRKIFIIQGIGFSLISAAGLYLFKQPSLIFISRLLAGVAASSWVVFSVLYSSYFHRGDSSKAISGIFIYQSTGTMAAMFLGGLAAQRYGWEASFLLGLLSALAALVLSFFIYDKSGDEEGKRDKAAITLKELTGVFKDPVLLVVSLLAILLQFNTFATVTGFTPIYGEGIGASKAQLGMLTFYSQLPVILAALCGRRGLYTKIGEKKTILLCFILMGIFSAIIPFIYSISVLYITQFISGFARGALMPVLMAMGINNIEPEKRATAMGAFQAIYGIGMVAGPVIFGFVDQWAGMNPGFYISGIICLMGYVIAKVFLKTKQEDLHDQLC